MEKERVVVHPALAQKLREKIHARRRELTQGEDEVNYLFEATDCKNRLGPYFSDERAAEDSQYLEMYLAASDDNQVLAKEVRSLTDRLAVQNIQYLKAKTDLRKAHVLVKELKNEIAELSRLLDLYQAKDED